MPVDPKTLSALSQALEVLENDPPHAVPTGVLAALADVARPGTRLRVDLDASRQIGAPLVTITETTDDSALLEPLTPRQRDVACLILDGRSNRDIARELGISIATVKDHVHAILGRLGLTSRGALIAASRPVTKI